MKKLLLFVPIFTLVLFSYSQNIPEHISHLGIYDFLDEMASEKLININTAIKPYSRELISQKLVEINTLKEQLNRRQKNELTFYLREYNLELNANSSEYKYNLAKNEHVNASLLPFGVYYSDSAFRMVVRPQWGIKYYKTGDSAMYHQWGGAEMMGYIGKNFGFYASLIDHTQNRPLSGSTIITQEQGAMLKGEASNNYSEIRGGITYSWKWGNVGLIKDNLQWGENYHGANILSGRTQSVAMLKLNIKPTKWFEFNYFHARLASNVLDSASSYNYDGSNIRLIMRPKYMAANMFTFTPWRGLNLSVGNSIIYSDESIQLQYLIPFMFFKSVDDTYNATENQAGNNSQIFATISSRNIKHLHLYASLFIDEMSIKRMFKPTEQSNFISIKAGVNISNFPFRNLSLTSEYTRNNPLVYQHFIPTTTYASGSINMGNYMGDNSDELFLLLKYKPISRLELSGSFTIYRLGTRYHYAIDDPWGLPFMQTEILRTSLVSFKAEYEALNNVYVYFEGTQFNNSGTDSYNPLYLRSNIAGKQDGLMLNGGFAIGF